MLYPEGVIKFTQDLTDEVIFIPEELEGINRLRRGIYGLGLIGVYPPDHPEFPGIGFGNVSQRVGTGTGFIITGSATGKLRSLGPSDYTLVEHFDIQGNFIMSRGGTPASSESLTHAAVYLAVPGAKYVAHGHHAGLWEKREDLGFPATSAGVEYGTPEMANEVMRLYQEIGSDTESVIVSMAGHRDGLIAWGKDIDELLKLFDIALSRL